MDARAHTELIPDRTIDSSTLSGGCWQVAIPDIEQRSHPGVVKASDQFPPLEKGRWSHEVIDWTRGDFLPHWRQVTDALMAQVALTRTIDKERRPRSLFPKLLTLRPRTDAAPDSQPSAKEMQALHQDTQRGFSHWPYAADEPWRIDSSTTWEDDPVLAVIFFATETDSTRLPKYRFDERTDSSAGALISTAACGVFSPSCLALASSPQAQPLLYGLSELD